MIAGGGGREPELREPGGSPSRVTALASSGPRAEAAGATALKTEPEQKLSPAEQLEVQLPFAKPDAERPPPRRAAPKPRPRATKARCAASA